MRNWLRSVINAILGKVPGKTSLQPRADGPRSESHPPPSYGAPTKVIFVIYTPSPSSPSFVGETSIITTISGALPAL
jgi:hypothetical protein